MTVKLIFMSSISENKFSRSFSTIDKYFSTENYYKKKHTQQSWLVKLNFYCGTVDKNPKPRQICCFKTDDT